MADNVEPFPAPKTKPGGKDFIWVRPADIAVEDGFNVRFDLPDVEEMLASIVAEGVQEPIHVRLENGLYIVEAGHRRIAGVKLGIERGISSEHLEWVPCRVVRTRQGEAERLLLQLVRNSHAPLSQLELAYAVQRLVQMDVPREEICARSGFSRRTFFRLKSLLTIPTHILAYVAEKRIAPVTLSEARTRFPGDQFEPAFEAARKAAAAVGSDVILPSHFPNTPDNRSDESDEPVRLLTESCREAIRSRSSSSSQRSRAEAGAARTILRFVQGKLDVEQAIAAIMELQERPVKRPRAASSS